VKALIAKDWKLRDSIEKPIPLVSKSLKQTCPLFFSSKEYKKYEQPAQRKKTVWRALFLLTGIV
jgi:hypothetical protein